MLPRGGTVKTMCRGKATVAAVGAGFMVTEEL